jgi:methyltransferase
VRPAPLGALAIFFAFLALQYGGELWLSARHQRRLRARGAFERGRAHFPLLVAVHVLFPVALAVEVLRAGARPPAAWPLALAALIAAQALRLWSMTALGEHWSVRVLVVPGAARIRRGPYRFLAHPNYLAVVVELIAAPLMFGAWRTAVAIGAINAVALGVRIRCEDRALAEAAG